MDQLKQLVVELQKQFSDLSKQLQDMKNNTSGKIALLIGQQNIIPGAVHQRHISDGYIIFHGVAASRPINSTTQPNAILAYFATDTYVLSIWTGLAWKSSAPFS